MLFPTISTGSLLAAVGAVSSPIFDSISPYIYVGLGLTVAFVVARYLISLFKHGVGKPAGSSGSDTDQLRRRGSDSESQAEISRQFPLM